MFCLHSLVNRTSPERRNTAFYRFVAQLTIRQTRYSHYNSAQGTGFESPKRPITSRVALDNRPKTQEKIHLLVFSREPIISPPWSDLRLYIFGEFQAPRIRVDPRRSPLKLA
ncbi:MAG: hypothetical protein RLZZ396_2103 [Planctomycetota bacterium]